MLIEVDVSRYFAWERRPWSEVKDGDIAVQSDLHETLAQVQVAREEEGVAHIDMPDEDWDRMVSDHEAAMSATNRPTRSRRRLLVDHLQACLDANVPAGSAVRVRVLGQGGLAEGERASLEKFLNTHLVEESE